MTHIANDFAYFRQRIINHFKATQQLNLANGDYSNQAFRAISERECYDYSQYSKWSQSSKPKPDLPALPALPALTTVLNPYSQYYYFKMPMIKNI
ncbi:MAG: hypothetical protein LBQ12_14435 [Deltaproteobacteria bacterium]|nr:hypothetical protein [Deltaproteobacteria bacterium]